MQTTMIDTAVAESASFEEFVTFLTFRERVGLYMRLKRTVLPDADSEELDAAIAKASNERQLRGALNALLAALEARILSETEVA